MKKLLGIFALLAGLLCSSSSWAGLSKAAKEEAYILFNSNGLPYLQQDNQVITLAENNGEMYIPLEWDEFQVRILSAGYIPTKEVYRQLLAGITITNYRIKERTPVSLSNMSPKIIDKFYDAKNLGQRFQFTMDEVTALEKTHNFTVVKDNNTKNVTVDEKQDISTASKTEEPSETKKSDDSKAKSADSYQVPTMLANEQDKLSIPNPSGKTIAFNFHNNISFMNNEVNQFGDIVIPLRPMSEQEAKEELNDIAMVLAEQTKQLAENNSKGYKMQANGALQPKSPFSDKRNYLFGPTQNLTEQERQEKFDLVAKELEAMMIKHEGSYKNTKRIHADPRGLPVIGAGEILAIPQDDGTVVVKSHRDVNRKLRNLGLTRDFTKGEYGCLVSMVKIINNGYHDIRARYPKEKVSDIYEKFLSRYRGRLFTLSNVPQRGECKDNNFVLGEDHFKTATANSSRISLRKAIDMADKYGIDLLSRHINEIAFHVDKVHMSGDELTFSRKSPSMTKAAKANNKFGMFKEGYAFSNSQGYPTNDIRNVNMAWLLYEIMTPEEQEKSINFIKTSKHAKEINDRIIAHFKERKYSIYHKSNEHVVALLSFNRNTKRDIASISRTLRKQSLARSQMAKN